MNDLIILSDNKALTTSLKIAEYFEKRHANVLRDIKNVISELKKCSSENSKLSFQNNENMNFKDGTIEFIFSEYKVEDNVKNYSMYYLSRDAFMLLVMRYKGEKALTLKLSYINAFNKMQDYINLQINRQVFLDDSKNRLECLRMLCRLNKKDKRLFELGIKVVENMIPDELRNAYIIDEKGGKKL